MTPWTAAHQACLSFTITRVCANSSIDSVMPSNHLILCCPLLFLPSIFPIIRVFSNKLALHIMWPKYWSFSISPSNEYSGLMSFRIDCFDLLTVQRTRIFSSTSIGKHQIFGTQPSLWSTHIHTWLIVLSVSCNKHFYFLILDKHFFLPLGECMCLVWKTPLKNIEVSKYEGGPYSELNK